MPLIRLISFSIKSPTIKNLEQLRMQDEDETKIIFNIDLHYNIVIPPIQKVLKEGRFTEDPDLIKFYPANERPPTVRAQLLQHTSYCGPTPTYQLLRACSHLGPMQCCPLGHPKRAFLKARTH